MPTDLAPRPRTPQPGSGSPVSPPRFRGPAVAAATAIGLVYGAIYLGVVEVGRADPGELGVLGAAGLIHLALAGLLLVSDSRLVWGGIALFQIAIGAMYFGVAPDRDPAFEIWGLTIRALSAVLVVVLIASLIDAWRHRRST